MPPKRGGGLAACPAGVKARVRNKKQYDRAMLLPREFFARDALLVARELVGHHVKRGRVELRITETEAYRYPDDTANHCTAGVTNRNRPMWGPPGHAYVYLCYGMHNMLNLVTNAEGEGAAVLIRACEPVAGVALVSRRRGGKEGPVLLTGPGKVGQALALDTSWSGHDVCVKGGLEVHAGEPPSRLLAGPRVGIGYASPKHIQARWRFALADTHWVSARTSLEPLRTRRRQR